jgi:hypothetical protein
MTLREMGRLVQGVGMGRRTLEEIGRSSGTDKISIHGYHSFYQHYFEAWRDRTFILLEIGVDEGKSLRMWEEYFEKAVIVGMDIHEKCRRYNTNRTKVVIGDQMDTAFLAKVSKECGPFGIVIDDGCHRMAEQMTSFLKLLPHVSQDGLYVIEDLETSYSTSFGGGEIGCPTATITFLKSVIDDLNASYHRESKKVPVNISGIHFHKNIVFIERA